MALLLRNRSKTRFIPEPTLEAALAELDAIYRPELAPVELEIVEDVQILPDHFGRKGAAAINTRLAGEYLDAGHTAAAAVQLLMTASGLAQSTARKYVRAAAKVGTPQILPITRAKARRARQSAA